MRAAGFIPAVSDGGINPAARVTPGQSLSYVAGCAWRIFKQPVFQDDVPQERRS
jgi:hypothetical protein